MMSNTLATSETRSRFVTVASDRASVTVRWNPSVEMFHSMPRVFVNLLSLGVVSVPEFLGNLLEYRRIIGIPFPECEPTVREQVRQLLV